MLDLQLKNIVSECSKPRYVAAKLKNYSCPRLGDIAKNELNYNLLAVFAHFICDVLVVCDDCNTEYEGDCPVHGPLVIIKDTEVSIV